MKNMKLKIGILLVVALVATSGVYMYWQGMGASTPLTAEGKQELTLARPTFDASVAAVATTLDEEAGMSCWLNATADAPLSLTAAMSAMTNVEINTTQYVIGSISLQSLGFSSDDWPHCFVHQNGWIVVYYLKGVPVGKAFPMYKDAHWNWYDKDSYQLNDNLLHKALAMIASQIPGISDITATQYYHFQHPSATTLELAIKTATSSPTTRTFNTKVPGSFTIDEYSWSYYASYKGTFSIDTTPIFSDGGRHYGGPEITANVLSPDVWHTVTVFDNYYFGSDYVTVCILILYH